MKFKTPFHGQITATGEHVTQALRSTIFQLWIKNLDQSFVLRSVHFQSVDIVKKKGNPHVLFAKMIADIEDGAGNKLPGIVFLRGAAVAVLIVLECKGKKHVVLVEGAMPAIGWIKYAQLPAGMMDDEIDPAYVAIREIKEETTLEADPTEVSSLTRITYENAYGIYPSPGACDETIHVFYWKKKVTEKELEALAGKKTGLAEEHEHLRLKIVPLELLCQATPDVKAHSAYVMYTNAIARGSIT